MIEGAGLAVGKVRLGFWVGFRVLMVGFNRD